MLANAPSTVKEIVDVSDVGAPDSTRYAEPDGTCGDCWQQRERVDESAVFV